jgi:hypothetical protein
VLLDVGGGWVPWGIAGHEVVIVALIFVLVDADVIDTHNCWKVFCKYVKVDGGETVRHAEIANDGHGLFWDSSGANIAIWSHRWGRHGPGLVLAHIPRNITLFASRIFEGVGPEIACWNGPPLYAFIIVTVGSYTSA